MLSTPHLLVGATVGSFFPSPLVSFTVGFISHFVMDSIPHWDFKPVGWKLKIVTFAEFFFGAALLFYLTKHSSNPFLIWAGATGGVFPDVLAAPYYLLDLEIPFLEPLRRIHGQTQKHNHKFSTFTGIATQIITLFVTGYVLFLVSK